MVDDNFEQLLEMAFREDLADIGDATSEAIFSDEIKTAKLISKDTGVLAGSEQYKRAFARYNSEIKVELKKREGDLLQKGDIVALVTGPIRAVLSAERVALNFLAFLSGIATITRSCVEAAGQSGRAVILDTRKTLPGYRRLSKYAVTVGGGQNHRMGLHDMVMIKDNHIDAAGSITAAIEKVRAKWQDRLKIEVECRNKDEVIEAIEAGADIVMLDNMDEQQVAEAVKLRKGDVLFEASGDMDVDRIKKYSPTGIDYISVGKLTHSVKSFNFSMQLER